MEFQILKFEVWNSGIINFAPNFGIMNFEIPNFGIQCFRIINFIIVNFGGNSNLEIRIRSSKLLDFVYNYSVF